MSNGGDVTGHHGTTDYDDYWVVKLSSDIIGIAENAALPDEFAIDIFPNPFNSAVSISVDCRGLINQTPTVEIFDVLGKLIDKLSGGDQIWKPGAAIGSGVYLVRAKIGGNKGLKPLVAETDCVFEMNIVY